MKASKAWIIKPTLSGVKRDVQCLLKIGGVVLLQRTVVPAEARLMSWTERLVFSAALLAKPLTARHS
jgi:hypothetical protein